MALIWPDKLCELCHKPLGEDFDDVIGFAFIGVCFTAPDQFQDSAVLEIINRFPDSAVHASCLSRWEHRDTFIQFWNTQLHTAFGPNCEILTVDANHHVTYTREA